MRPSVRRRDLVLGAMAASLAVAPAALAADDAFRALEARSGARLGVFAMRLGGASVAWRADERFRMCSTFKALAAGAVLAKVDDGTERLDRSVRYGAHDLMDYAPVAKAHAGKGAMTVAELCAAAVELSDNTAANLILASLGGPQGVTSFMRRLGDQTTRLDRIEPELNRGAPSDPRDTTTPRSMVDLWRRLLVEDALSPKSRDQLMAWLAACQTGADRLPLAAPKGWRIGHKTGSGDDTHGDVAILTPPAGRPILIAVYFNLPKADGHDALIAQAGRIAIGRLTDEARA
jgi:beta-lactamase class A